MKIDEVKKSYFLVYLRAINISCIFTHLTFLIYGEIKGMHFSSVLILDDIFEPLCTLVRNLPLGNAHSFIKVSGNITVPSTS